MKSRKSFDTLQHLSGLGYSGVRIGNWVVSFSPEENFRSSAIYTIQNSTAGMWHLIADITRGSYDVFVNGKKTTTLEVRNGDNTALFQTNIAASTMTIRLASSNSSSISSWLNLLLKKE